MIDLAKRIRELQVPEGRAGMFWLGQSGFVFKTGGGTVFYVDAYLSDSVERKFGPTWRRIMPSLLAPEEVACDYFLSTHEHDDHLDVDAIPVIARDPKVQFGGPRECVAFYRTLGLPPERYMTLRPAMAVELDGVLVNVVYADHGDLAPDAIGLVFDFGSLRVYHTGDTAFRPDKMGVAARLCPEVILPCINPAYGNLGAKSAASLAGFVGAKIAYPTHFWTFAEHGGDPAEFMAACEEFAPDLEVRLLTQGQGVIL